MLTKTTLALSVIAATALTFAITPALIQSAAAVPAPATDPGCSDDKFDELPSCPGKSEDAQSDKRDDQCTPRNRGHIDDCEALVEDDEDVTDPVNPPNK
jgi:hypothetical protein